MEHVRVGQLYEVLDPSWVDAKGRKSAQPNLKKGSIVLVTDVDGDGDAVVFTKQPYDGEPDAIVAPQHLKPYGPPPPEPDGYGTIPLF